MSIKLFTKPACMQCNATKKALDRAGLDYEVVDISDYGDRKSVV